jgi:hypothetical protein
MERTSGEGDRDLGLELCGLGITLSSRPRLVAGEMQDRKEPILLQPLLD